MHARCFVTMTAAYTGSLGETSVIQFVERGPICLWTEGLGIPARPCVLLISGAGSHAAFWPDDFCRRLVEAGLFVIRYDHRDIGYSTHTEADYDLITLLDDAMAVLDAHRVVAAHLVGHSMGGYLAAMASAYRALRVLSATMISAGPTVTPAVAAELGLSSMRPETWEALLENRPTGDFEADLPGWMRSWHLLHGHVPLDEAMATRYTRELYVRDARDAAVAERHVAAMRTVPASFASDLTRVATPGLVIHGTEDPLVPVDHGAALARLIPGCRLRLIPGAGHMFLHPDLWSELATQILEHVSSSEK
jgi:pimeloyl-ACP methyl ester carboxylesterase